jgi:uncharacterized protein (DUF1501 family)
MAPHDVLSPYTRRGFLRQLTQASVGISAASIMRDLRLISSASAQTVGPSDYKALVCIFLAGGNDSDNTIVDLSQWSNYLAVRDKLALPEPGTSGLTLDQTLIPVDLLPGPTGTTAHTYGLHPALRTMNGSAEQGIRKLFQTGRASAVFNVGPLIRPISKDEYDNASPFLPPQLFSHHDQAIHWQTSLPDRPTTTGWAGRMADLLQDGVPTYNSGKISLNTSIAGTNMFQTGADFNQFNVSTRGAVTLKNKLEPAIEWFGGWQHGLKNIAESTGGNTNLQRAAYAGVLNRAMETGDYLNAALATNEVTWTTAFPATSLGSQLKTVARMIAARGTTGGGLGINRQTFFVQVGGYDTHGDQVFDSPLVASPPANSARHLGIHANLLKELSDAVWAFQAAMAQLSIEDKVVSFTASDFGRTFRSNGLGSDHGWGAHHFVFGGSSVLKGGRTFGSLPDQDILSSTHESLDNGGAGRWIPKISVDEYCAPLANWFGVGAGDMDAVFPNLGNMDTTGVPYLNI